MTCENHDESPDNSYLCPHALFCSRDDFKLSTVLRTLTAVTARPVVFRSFVAIDNDVLQTVKAAARTVTLSADPLLVASAMTKGTAFDLRSIKPGMLVDTTVNSMLSNGMLVKRCFVCWLS